MTVTLTLQDIAILVSIVAAIQAVAIWVVRALIGQNNAVLIEKINGTYLKREYADLKFGHVDVSQQATNARLTAVEMELRMLREHEQG